MNEKKKSPWIKCSERMPTEADADRNGNVEWSDLQGSVEWRATPPEWATHWRPTSLPDAPKEEVTEDDFENALDKYKKEQWGGVPTAFCHKDFLAGWTAHIAALSQKGKVG